MSTQPAEKSRRARLLAAACTLALGSWLSAGMAPDARVGRDGGDHPSSSTERNGSGVNLLRFSELSPAVIGLSWDTKVDLVGAEEIASILVVSVGGATENIFISQGELLCLPPFMPLDIGSGSHSLPIPLDTGLLGVTLSTQAAVVRPGEIRLTNAIDIKIGAF